MAEAQTDTPWWLKILPIALLVLLPAVLLWMFRESEDERPMVPQAGNDAGEVASVHFDGGRNAIPGEDVASRRTASAVFLPENPRSNDVRSTPSATPLTLSTDAGTEVPANVPVQAGVEVVVGVNGEAQHPYLSTAQQTFAEQRWALRRCYERGLQRAPTLRGSLALRVQVRTDGSVEDLTPRGGLFASQQDGAEIATQVRDCITNTVRGMVLPSPGAAPVQVGVMVLFTRE